jgi:NTE family protein
MRPLLFLALALLLAGCATQPIIPPAEQPAVVPPLVGPPPKPIRIGLALGGGAARGFAHIGVIKVLEAQGIVPDLIAGTSAGSVVGALYAAGLDGFELQKVGMELDEATLADWSFPSRGLFKGEALQDFVNRQVRQKPLERLGKPFAAVATDLKSGEMVAFRTGNTGMAVRASSAVPGIFKPVAIREREYVDGGLTSPVPVRAVKAMGADFVIAVDVGSKPQWGKSDSTLDLLLRTFTIMGQHRPAGDGGRRPGDPPRHAGRGFHRFRRPPCRHPGRGKGRRRPASGTEGAAGQGSPEQALNPLATSPTP